MLRLNALKLFLSIGILLSFISSCKNESKPSFSNWYKSRSNQIDSNEKNKVLTKTFYSSSLSVDTIYRSMQGPYEIKEIGIAENEEEVIWITAYESRLINSIDQEYEEDRFMCHNNLNYRDTSNIPWNLKTSGGNPRIFTLSEGQTKLEFPEGFGIPVPATQKFEMVSQVLNHLDKDIDLKLKHEVKLSYIKDSDRKNTILPLYQQAIYVTKQIAGPKGAYGLPKLCVNHHLDSSSIDGKQPNHDCSTVFHSKKYNPLEDSEGRKYTGHWKIPYGKETLSTDVSPMLDLNENTSIHLIGVHLHPFAAALELWDTSIDSLLYSAKIEARGTFGFKNVEYYSSKSGIPVFASHKYELRSTYNNQDSLDNQTAMAVMYLYLKDI